MILMGREIIGRIGAAEDESTVETRIARLEAILSQFDKEPPPLGDADDIRYRLDGIRGEVERVARIVAAMDGWPDIFAQQGRRLGILENVTGVAVVPRDVEHESKSRRDNFLCLCGSRTQRDTPLSVFAPAEIPCNLCGSVMKIESTIDGDEAAVNDVTEHVERCVAEDKRIAEEKGAQ